MLLASQECNRVEYYLESIFAYYYYGCWFIDYFGNRKVKTKKVKGNAKEYVAIFSGVDEVINKIENDFKMTAVFGGIELDMRDVTLDSDLVIDCFTLFGGIDIRLPKDVKVEVNGLPIFGGVENKYRNNHEAKVTVYINHTTICGGVDLI